VCVWVWFLVNNFSRPYLLTSQPGSTDYINAVFIDVSLFAIIYLFPALLGSHTYSVRAFCFSRSICHLFVSLSVSVICLSRIISRKLSEIGAKFCRLCRKSGSPSKNVTSAFAPEIAKYPNHKIDQNSVRAYCLAPLAMRLVSFICYYFLATLWTWWFD